PGAVLARAARSAGPAQHDPVDVPRRDLLDQPVLVPAAAPGARPGPAAVPVAAPFLAQRHHRLRQPRSRVHGYRRGRHAPPRRPPPRGPRPRAGPGLPPPQPPPRRAGRPPPPRPPPPHP